MTKLKESLGKRFPYESDFEYHNKLVHIKYMIAQVEYTFLKNNLKQFNISPSFLSSPNPKPI